MVKWLWCVLFHRWTQYDAVRYGAAELDVEVEKVRYCLTCGRDRPSWLRA